MEIADYYSFIFISLALCFAALVINIVFGYFRRGRSKFQQVTELTVVVPFKNEGNLTKYLLDHLRSVIPSDSSVSVLFINDHSEDLTREMLKALEPNENFRLINLPDNLHGKKSAVRHGVELADTAWILQLDVDTLPSSRLFSGLQHFIPNEAKMVLIPLQPKKTPGIVPAFFDLDFLSLHFTGLGMARLGVPILSNAAAMLYNRQSYLEACKMRTDWNEPSGDDIFAMTAVKKIYGSKAVAVVPDLFPLASVQFPKGYRALWNQRLRWISKVGQVNNFWFQAISWVVLLVQILLLSGFLFIGLKEYNNQIAWSMTAIFVAEVVLLTFAAIYARRRELLVYLIPAVLIYPFYLLALVILSAIKRPSWK